MGKYEVKITRLIFCGQTALESSVIYMKANDLFISMAYVRIFQIREATAVRKYIGGGHLANTHNYDKPYFFIL